MHIQISAYTTRTHVYVYIHMSMYVYTYLFFNLQTYTYHTLGGREEEAGRGRGRRRRGVTLSHVFQTQPHRNRKYCHHWIGRNSEKVGSVVFLPTRLLRPSIGPPKVLESQLATGFTICNTYGADFLRIFRGPRGLLQPSMPRVLV